MVTWNWYPNKGMNNPFITQFSVSSDEGKTWRGFREVLLNSNRNDSRYAETGGMDRSVHQAQFVEVEAGRVLVSVGQHWLHRSLLLFDPDWLLERKRSAAYQNSLSDWCVHMYLVEYARTSP